MSRVVEAAVAGRGGFADLQAPFAFVDLDAFDTNAQTLLRDAGGLPVRVGSKSVRCSALIARALDAGFQGVLAFTPEEALHLADHGVADTVVAYPTVSPTAIRRVAERRAASGSAPVLVVDDPAHLALIGEVTAMTGTAVEVCIDVDLGWWPLGRRVQIGPKRSPLRTPAQVAAFARACLDAPGVEPVGLLAYDGHIAGVGDTVPGRAAYSRAVRVMQGRSLADIAHRLPAIVRAARAVLGDRLRFVNSSGTGSLARIAAIPDAADELTAGSGLYCSTLFDTYRSLRLTPAAGFVLPVVRRPGPEIATLLGGGYVASGAAGADRLPTPWWPAGLILDRDEGAGEVQTPVRGAAATTLRLGDRVALRHAKAGELCERFSQLVLARGDEVVDVVPTYRGEGHTFL